MTGVLDAGSEFDGKLAFQGTLRIGGAFKGQIFTPDTLIIGEGAKVSGEIDAGIVIISGEVHANIKARHRVEIHSPAVFRGSIVTPSLQVDEGVIFEGSSKMINSAIAPAPGVSPRAH
ncbi:MAG: polymer-forming cytoskeletal protein [Bdellovibrionales bacterium]|nr:polymer-forming cytoskeletal protein [Bdellovibrionales bacterium]